MANTVNITPLLSGSKRVVYHVFFKSDGATGELVDEVLIDPVVDLGFPKTTRMTLEKVLFHFAGFDARIEFQTGLTTDTFIWVLPEGSDSDVDFTPFGGVKDRNGSLDATGKVLISTTGFTSSTDQGSMILQVRLD